MMRKEHYPQDGGYGDRRYILDTEPSHPYHQSQQYPQHHQYDDRYNY
jgi:hypothetical protein